MEELRRLDLVGVGVEPGVVRFQGTAEDGARATLALRSAPRVLLEIARRLPADRDALFSVLRSHPWEDHLPPRRRWAVRAHGAASDLRHSGYTAQFVKDAVRSRFGVCRRSPPPIDPLRPEVVVDVRVDRRGVDVSLDLAGASLHRRSGAGRRGAAPLREDVAAGLALLAGVDATAPLLDPFCGSGAVITEAAAVALRRHPVREPRMLALSRLPAFGALRLDDVARGLRSQPAPPHAEFLAYDRDPAAVDRTRAAAAAQGLADHLTVQVGEVPDLRLPVGLAPGLLLTNPPWGRRLGLSDAQRAWAGLGRLAHGRLAGWRLALLSGGPALTRLLGLKAERRWPVSVGTVDARLLIYRVHPAPVID